MRYWGEVEVVRAFGTGMEQQPVSPPVDMYETEDAFVVECDLPGVGLDLLKVTLCGPNVSIECGARKKPARGGPHQYHRVERSPEGFTREILLPGPVHGRKSLARYENGVLKIVLPKMDDRRGSAITIPVEISPAG